LVGAGMFLLFVPANIAYYFQFKQGHGPNSDFIAVLQMVVELLMPVPVYVFALTLGVVSLFFSNRKKLFPILAVVGNLILGLISLIPWIWLVIASMGRV
jgi:hypothetical protein